MLGRRPTDATAAFDLELSAWRSGMEYLTHLNAACDKIFARSRNIGDDQVEAFVRPRRGRCYLSRQTEPSTRSRAA
jgi:hypothetical protein